MSKIALEALFEGIKDGSFDESTKEKLTTLINETVDARVDAKEKLLKEEYETKQKVLLEETEALKSKILAEAKENEEALVENAEAFKKELEETLVEETLKFKTLKEEQLKAELAKKDEEVTKFCNDIKEIALTETKEFKEKQDAALVEEVKNFKANMIQKVSEFLEEKLTEHIPAEIMESAAKVAVLEPIVTSIMEGFSKNYVKIDTSSYNLIKEAKNEIATLEKKLQESMKLELSLKKEIKEVNRNMKIKSLTEGLTQAQKEKAVKLLEDVENDELEERFSKIRDIIIESTVIAPKKPTVAKPLTESTDKKEATTTSTAAENELVKMQMKKVLNESESKTLTGTNASKSKNSDNSNSVMKTWASKVKPGYIEDKK